jgi:predicted TIM-barrel fold metal-dependent hydrolase
VIVDAVTHMYATGAPGRPPATPEAVLALMDAAGVDGVIQATPFASGYDNSYSLAIAAQHANRIRVMARIDPVADGVEARLDSLWADRNVVGVRLVLDAAGADAVATPSYAPFWGHASELGIPVEIYLAGRNHVLLDVCARHPDVRLMLDHIGMVYGAADPFEHWQQLLDLVPADNIAIRVSAIPELTNEGPPFSRSRQLLCQLAERFGAERLVWGSNFPVITRVCSYRDSLDLVRGCEDLTAEDRARILGGNLVEIGDRSRWFSH